MDEGGEHGREEAALGQARSAGSVAYVLLVQPALGVLAGYVEPDGWPVSAGPANATTEGAQVERTEVVEEGGSARSEELDHHAWAEASGGAYPLLVEAVDEGYQVLTGQHTGALEAVAPPGDIAQVAAEDVQGDIFDRPTAAHCGDLPFVL